MAIGEKQKRTGHSGNPGMRGDAGHAARFEQFLHKRRLRPVRGPVLATSHQTAVLRIRVTCRDDHAAIRERGDVWLARIGHGDVAPLPTLARVVTEDDADGPA